MVPVSATTLSLKTILIVLVLTVTGVLPAAQGQSKADRIEAVAPARELYNEISVALELGVDAKMFAADNGLTINRQMVGAGNRWIFNTATVAEATTKATALRGIAGVESVF